MVLIIYLEVPEITLGIYADATEEFKAEEMMNLKEIFSRQDSLEVKSKIPEEVTEEFEEENNINLQDFFD